MLEVQLASTSTATLFGLFIIFIPILRFIRSSLPAQIASKLGVQDFLLPAAEPTGISRALALALPESVILPHDTIAFTQFLNHYWARQECEVIPACVVRPRNSQELRTAVQILKREYDERVKQAGSGDIEGLFAVRGGGNSPLTGAASIDGGVVIDLGLFRNVTPSDDGTYVAIGAGAKWKEVSTVLDQKGLAVVGGRNAAVGVGGLTLGGGLSFFSPRYGFVCSNIISYEVVLASGFMVTASESVNPDLWLALKGGSNNFGVVTTFTARSFPSVDIWSGFLYMPSFQAPKVLTAFHEAVGKEDSENPSTRYDEHAAGPIATFVYIHSIGVKLIVVNLVYTKAPGENNDWPVSWQTFSFKSLWRFWSTCKVRSLTDASDELHAAAPFGKRQIFATTTFKNDRATITAAYATYCDAIAAIREKPVKGFTWSFVMQPLLPKWASKGDPNVLGLQDSINEAHVILSLMATWDDGKDDKLVRTTIRHTLEQIDAIVVAKKTGHRYRYLNYCADWQKPFPGYGEENWRFLQQMSRKYDPDGLFQKGCKGGFKLDLEISSE